MLCVEMEVSPLITERLTIRSIKADDAPELFRILSSYPEISTYMTVSPPDTLQEVSDSIQNAIESDDLKLAVCIEGKLMGLVTLRNFHWWQQESNKASVFLSFWISPEHGRKGYGTEMLREVCRFGFENLGIRKIFAGAFTQNIPSQKLLEKMEFRQIGILQDHYLKKGILYDSVRYELLSEHFLKQNVSPRDISLGRVGEKEERDFLSAPFKTIRTPSMTLRRVEEADANALFEITNTYPEISTYMTWNTPKDLEDTRYKCIRMRRDGDLNLAITTKSGRIIGKATLRNFRFTQKAVTKNSAFLSYWFTPREDKDETIQEFLQTICKYGFQQLGLRKIMAGIFADNAKTSHQLEQFGFVLIGRLENHYGKNNTEYDSLRYELLASDIS